MAILKPFRGIRPKKELVKNIACHPKFWIMFAPASSPIVAPAGNVAVNMDCPIANFFSGSISRMIPNAIGNMEIPMP